MADVKKIATRDSYGNALKELGAEHDDLIVFDADLAGATKTGTFQKAFPERHFDCGIAEGNMMAVAAGAAAMGLVPFGEDRRHPRRHLRGRGRGLPPVLRGLRPDALHPRHGGHVPRRRRGGQGHGEGRL